MDRSIDPVSVPLRQHLLKEPVTPIHPSHAHRSTQRTIFRLLLSQNVITCQFQISNASPQIAFEKYSGAISA
jgi:hypothetical protein